MHAIVVGCGRVGAGLAVALEEAGHTASVIDRNPRAFRRLPGSFGGRQVTGLGFDRDRLAQAGIRDAGAVAAVTNGDNSNIVVARVAREAFHIDRVVARIYDPRRAAIYERLGIPTIASVQWTTDRVLQRILPESPEVAWTDPSTRVVIVERAVPDAAAGKPLEALELPGRARVVAVTRLGVAQISTPESIAQQDDVLWIAVAADSIEALDEHVSATTKAGGH